MPDLSLQWLNETKDTLAIRVEGEDSRWEECVKNGLQARYRLEVKVCKKLSVWFDNCGDRLVETRSMEKDPISDMVRVGSDRMSDVREPESSSAESYAEALALMHEPHEILLSDIPGAGADLVGKKGVYLQVHVITACRGEVSPMLRRVSQFLSFGLLDLQDRSGMSIDFPLK